MTEGLGIADGKPKEPQYWPGDESTDCCTRKAKHDDGDVDHGSTTALIGTDAICVEGKYEPRSEQQGGSSSAQRVLGEERDKARQEAHSDKPERDELAAKTVVVAGSTVEQLDTDDDCDGKQSDAKG